MRAFRRHCRLLRTALLAMLVLGMAISPVLAAAGELHGLQHAAKATSNGAHGHAESAGSDHHHHDGGAVDPDHASGGHGLMHLAGCMSVAWPGAVLNISLQTGPEALVPEFTGFQLPGDCPSLPFRPPIA